MNLKIFSLLIFPITVSDILQYFYNYKTGTKQDRHFNIFYTKLLYSKMWGGICVSG